MKTDHDNDTEAELAAWEMLREARRDLAEMTCERDTAISAIRWIMESVGDQTCECACPPDVAGDSPEPFGDPAAHAEYCPIYIRDFCRRNLPDEHACECAGNAAGLAPLPGRSVENTHDDQME